eukprot:9697150-Alexandrium_andersonii.AAC.1
MAADGWVQFSLFSFMWILAFPGFRTVVHLMIFLARVPQPLLLLRALVGGPPYSNNAAPEAAQHPGEA